MADMINVYLYGKKYEVPSNLTIMEAFEYAGYQLVRGCGCRNGFCGACATIYRIKGKNELVGFDIDLSKEIAKKLGVEADFILTEFGGLTMALNAGKFDVGISAISITEKRAKEVDFSEPYVKGGQVIVVKKGTTDIKSVNDILIKR